MKEKVKVVFSALVLLLLIACKTEAATIGIEWKNSAGIVTIAGGGPTDYVDQALVQIIWTSVMPSAQASAGGGLGASEWLLNGLITTSGFAGTFDDGLSTYEDADVGGNNILDGWFFVRMFDVAATGVGDWYLQQAITGTPLTEYNPLDTTTLYSTGGQLGGSLDGEVGESFQVVPEPGTMALFGIGLVTLAAKARKRKK